MNKRTIHFIKMSGAGNDFVVIDAKKGLNYKNLAIKICDRTNGIGADGLLVLDKSKKADYKMRIINADGSEAEMCGNGARCISAYIVRNKKEKKNLFSFETLAGIIRAEAKDEVAHVLLSNPKDYKTGIPITINGKEIHVDYIDTGVPHAVVFVDELKKIDVARIGRIIRFHERFDPRGTNVNFVEQLKENLVAVRTYERGVEDETKACGTGSVAAAIISYLKTHPCSNSNKAVMNVLTVSGEILRVSFKISDNNISEVWLKGSAKFIAEGKYNL